MQVCRDPLLHVLAQPDPYLHYGIPVSIIDIAHADPTVAEEIIDAPRRAIPLLEQALIGAQVRP